MAPTMGGAGDKSIGLDHLLGAIAECKRDTLFCASPPVLIQILSLFSRQLAPGRVTATTDNAVTAVAAGGLDLFFNVATGGAWNVTNAWFFLSGASQIRQRGDGFWND